MPTAGLEVRKLVLQLWPFLYFDPLCEAGFRGFGFRV